jgi:hypothetical protein
MAEKETKLLDGVLSENQQETTMRLLEKWRFAILGIGAIALFLPWVSVSGFLNQTVSGFAFDTGKLYLLALIAIAAMDYTEFKFDQEQIWLGGGTVLTLLAGLSWFNVSSAISEFRMETAGNPFAGAVSINAGLGLYLAVLVGILVIAVGWTLWQAPPAGLDAGRVE